MKKELERFDKKRYSETPNLWEVTTMSGRPVRILCTDGEDEEYPVIGLIDGHPHSYKSNGEEHMIFYHADDLFMQWSDDLPDFNVLTEELATKYDGKCYADFDDYKRIEAVRFFKDEKGLNIQSVGTDGLRVSYNWCDYDEIGTEGADNTYSLPYINMIKDGVSLLKEITKEKFDEIVDIVAQCEHFRNERDAWIKSKQLELGIYPENYN